MTLEMYVIWSSTGLLRWDQGDNLCSISLRMHDTEYIFTAVYLHPSRLVGERRAAYEEIEKLRRQFPPGSQEVCAGDWKSHTGLDFVGDQVHTGQHMLHTPTTMGGRVHKAWLHTTSLCMIDSFRPAARRATWRHNVTGQLYELDFCCVSQAIRKQFQATCTFACSITDHWGKQVVVHLSSHEKARRRSERRDRFQHYERCRQLAQQKGQLRVQDMRGPTVAAGHRRAEFGKLVESELTALQLPLPVADHDELQNQDVTVDVEIYTDGSFGERGSTVAGWGLYVRRGTHSESYYAPVKTEAASFLYHGACGHSNNVGELEAIGMAFKWARKHCDPGMKLCVLYDSQYAANAVQQKQEARTNLELIQWVMSVFGTIHGAHLRVYVEKLQACYNLNREPWFWQPREAVVEPPLVAWDQLAHIVVGAAERVVGRKRPAQLGAPYSHEDLEAIHQLREDLTALWNRVRLEEDEEQRRVLKLSHRQLQRQLQRFRRQARGRFVQSICREAEESMHSHDTGKFYRTLKKLGIHLSEHSNEGKVEHGLKELREHCQNVSGNVKTVKEDVLHDVPFRQVEQWLGDTPSSQEIRVAMSKVRDCASGWDEVTAGMLRWSGPMARQCVVSLVQYLWNAPPAQWERSIKTGIGVYMYKNKGREYCDEFNMAVGFREGCPSSPVCFSVFHNFAIRGFLQLRKKHGDEGLRLSIKPGGPLNTRKALSKKPEHDEVMRLLAVLFADDTTGLTRLSHLDAFEKDMQDALELYEEKLHPGKTHRLRAGHLPGPRSKFDDAVRFLGVWLQWDGGHDRDTHERLTAASRVWGQLSRQLPRLGLAVWQKGQVVNATVVNCLLFGCERRTYTSKQLSKFQSFLNRITFLICGQRRRTMSDDQLTLADLRKKCGILPVRHVIETRQLQYLGHLARLPPERLERQALWSSLWPEAEWKGKKTGPTLRQAYWRLLRQIMAFSSVPAFAWSQRWIDVAAEQDGTTWRRMLRSWDKQFRANEKQYEWANKHATGAVLQPDGYMSVLVRNCLKRFVVKEQYNVSSDAKSSRKPVRTQRKAPFIVRIVTRVFQWQKRRGDILSHVSSADRQRAYTASQNGGSNKRARAPDGTAQMPGSSSSGDAELINQLLRSHLLQDNLVREATNATKLCLLVKAPEDQEAISGLLESYHAKQREVQLTPEQRRKGEAAKPHEWGPRKVFLFTAVMDRLMQQYGEGTLKTTMECFKAMDPADLDFSWRTLALSLPRRRQTGELSRSKNQQWLLEPMRQAQTQLTRDLWDQLKQRAPQRFCRRREEVWSAFLVTQAFSYLAGPLLSVIRSLAFAWVVDGALFSDTTFLVHEWWASVIIRANLTAVGWLCICRFLRQQDGVTAGSWVNILAAKRSTWATFSPWAGSVFAEHLQRRRWADLIGEHTTFNSMFFQDSLRRDVDVLGQHCGERRAESERGDRRGDRREDDQASVSERLDVLESRLESTAALASATAYRVRNESSRRSLVYFVQGDLKARLLQVHTEFLDYVKSAVGAGPSSANVQEALLPRLDTEGKAWPVVLVFRSSEAGQATREHWLLDQFRPCLGKARTWVRPARYMAAGVHRKVAEFLPQKGGGRGKGRRSPKREPEAPERIGRSKEPKR
ncbi:unnamed protein product [Symbiodinium sp. CCMP2592]|nr:unnamed protein product [Symbiodinium sp. CCMP2592]